MVSPIRMELLEWIQAGVGWAMLAARARPVAEPTPAPVEALRSTPKGPAPMRLRATITIDIDARDADEAELESDAIRRQFELLKRAHPKAELAFQRRKPRNGRRAPPPALVVAPYVDD